MIRSHNTSLVQLGDNLQPSCVVALQPLNGYSSQSDRLLLAPFASPFNIARTFNYIPGLRTVCYHRRKTTVRS
jgi:hypothetical protein